MIPFRWAPKPKNPTLRSDSSRTIRVRGFYIGKCGWSAFNSCSEHSLVTSTSIYSSMWLVSADFVHALIANLADLLWCWRKRLMWLPHNRTVSCRVSTWIPSRPDTVVNQSLMTGTWSDLCPNRIREATTLFNTTGRFNLTALNATAGVQPTNASAPTLSGTPSLSRTSSHTDISTMPPTFSSLAGLF